MARKKKLDLDEFEIDKSLDFDIPDFDMKPPKDDRKPVTKAASGFLSGVKDTVVSPSFIKNTLRVALPRNYGEVFDFAETSTRSLKDLYNTSTRELRPALNELKRVTGRMLPEGETKLSPKMQKRLKEFADSADKSSGSSGDAREMVLQSTMTDVFRATAEMHADADADRDVKDRIKENIEFGRHKDNIEQLDSIRQSVTQLANYQKVIGSSFQRKSLEVQYRHYFTSIDILTESKKTSAILEQNLAEIRKNTGLPDFVKKTPSESMKELLRNKFVDSVHQGVFGKRSNFVRGVTEKLAGRVVDKVRDFGNNVMTGLSAAEQIADAAKMAKEMGMPFDPHVEAGKLAGGIAADTVGGKVGKWLAPHVAKIPGVIKYGNMGAYGVRNLPQMAQEWAQGYGGGEGLPVIGGTIGAVKDTVRSELSVNNSLETDHVKDMLAPTPYARQDHKALVEVIPGYLARLLQEAQMARTGNDKIQLTLYDYTKNQFGSKTEVYKNAFSKVVSTYGKQANKDQLEKMIDSISGSDKLTPEQRKALGQHLLSSNLKGTLGSKAKLMDSWSYTGAASKHATVFSDMFKNHFGEDKNWTKRLAFTDQYNELGRPIDDSRRIIQDFANAGMLDFLKDAGLVDPTGTQIDMEKFYSYFNEEEYNPDFGSTAESSAPGLGRRKGRQPKKRPRATLHKRAQPRYGHASPQPQESFVSHQHSQPQAAPTTVKFDSKEIVDTIKGESTKSTSEKILDMMLMIHQQIENGVGVYMLGEGHGGEHEGFISRAKGKAGKWYNQSIKGAASRAGSFMWSTLGKARNAGKNAANTFFSLGSTGLGVAKSALGKAYTYSKEKLKNFNEVYVKGELLPRLTNAKLKAGMYRDELTGKIIKSYKDITGPIRDLETGEIVIDKEHLKDLVLKSGAGQKVLEFGKSTFSKIRGLYGSAMGFGLNQIPRIMNAGKWAMKKAYSLLDGPADVYVRTQSGALRKALAKETMEAGGYTSDITGKPIKKVSDIDGAVTLKMHEVVLTQEEFNDGIFNKEGKPLRHGVNKITGKIKDAFKGYKNTLFGAASTVKNFFKGWIGKDGIVFSGSKKITDILLDIYKLLDKRMPGAAGDGKDEKGYRIGSYADQENAKKEKLKEDAEKGEAESGKSGGKLASLMASIKGLGAGIAGRFGKKDKDGDSEEDHHGLLDDAKEDAEYQGVKGIGKRLLKGGKGALKFAGKHLGRAGKGLLGLGGKLIPRMGGALGAEALMTGGAAAAETAAAGTAATAATAATGGGFLAGLGGLASGTAGVLGSVATGAAGLATGAASILFGALAIPVLIGAAAYGGYRLYKHYKNTHLDILEKVRFAQYGFSDKDSDHFGALKDTEDILLKAIVVKNGVPDIDGKKVDGKKIIDAFGIDSQNQPAVEAWAQWFVQRFKPVFLTSVAALNKVKPSLSLGDADGKLTADEKKAYLDIAKFPSGPYGVDINPFDLKAKLTVGKKEVEAAVAEAYAAIAKDKKDLGDKINKGATMATGVAATTVGTAAVPTSSLPPPKTVATAAGAKTSLAQIDNSGFQNNRGLISVAANAAPTLQAFNGRVDGLTAARFKTYGLKEMEADKIRALAALEQAVSAEMKLNSSKVAEWSGSGDKIFAKMSSTFGIDSKSDNMAEDWKAWFTNRFLPTYLVYATTIMAGTKKATVDSAVQALRPKIALDTALATIGATATRSGGNVAVWTFSSSPWPGYKLNMSISTTDLNIQGLKDDAKNETLSEKKANDLKGNKEGDAKNPTGGSIGGTGDKDNGKPQSFFDQVKNIISNPMGAIKSAGSAISGAWDAAKSALGFGGGGEITQPGHGTGGDINAIPKPKGDGSYAAMKEMLDAAAKAAGVDPRLMGIEAAIESGFKTNAKAGTSSAAGLFQFVSGTWQTMLKRYGAKYGINPNTPPTDPRAAALMGAEFIKENVNALKGTGKQISDTDVYLAHFLGAGGAVKFLKSDPNAIAAQGMPDAARANANIFYDHGRPRTFGEVYAYLNNLVRTRAKQFGIDGAGAGSEAIKPSAAKTATTAATPAKAGAKTATPAAASKTAPAVAATAAPAATVKSAPSSTATVPKTKALPVVPQLTQAAMGSSKSTSAIDELGSGFSPAAADLASNTRSRRSSSVSSKSGDSTLEKSLNVQEEMLKVLKTIADKLTPASGSSSGAQSDKGDNSPQAQRDVSTYAKDVMKSSSEMPGLPISLDKFGIS